MKCICGSGAEEEIERLTPGPWFKTQGLTTPAAAADYIIELQKRVTALQELWGTSIKNDEKLKIEIYKLWENKDILSGALENFVALKKPHTVSAWETAFRIGEEVLNPSSHP